MYQPPQKGSMMADIQTLFEGAKITNTLGETLRIIPRKGQGYGVYKEPNTLAFFPHFEDAVAFANQYGISSRAAEAGE